MFRAKASAALSQRTYLPDGWQLVRLGELIDHERPITYGVVQPGEHDPKGVPLVRGGDFSFGWRPLEAYRRVAPEIETTYSRARLKPGDLVITIKGDVGAAAIVPDFLDGANISQTNARLAIDTDKADARFILAFLQSEEGKRQIRAVTQIGAQPGLIFRDIANFRIGLPPLSEQQAIADRLMRWDAAIDKMSNLEELHRRHLAGISLTVFEPQFGQNAQLIRAQALFEPIVERNRPDLPLLAVMQDVGIVRRDELHRRVAMPDGDVSVYKVVRPGDFVISLRSFEGGLEYSNVLGLVSPAYTVLRPTTRIDSRYYRFFFKSRSFVGRLDKLIFGIRDGKQIAFRDFGDMLIPFPPIGEQKSHAAALAAAEEAIRLIRELKRTLGRQKRGLMQKLLTRESSLLGTKAKGAVA